MELRQIQYFVQLYKDRNITKASQTLYISQQGLSKSIRKLEEELGFLLFERSVSGVIPTDYAHKLYLSFQKVTDSYHDLTLEIDHIREERILKIMAPVGLAAATDKDLFAEYTLLYPEAKTRYKEDTKEATIQYLKNHDADVAFMLAPIPEEFQSHQIVGRSPLYAVMSQNHPLACRESITISDLENQALLLLDLYEEFHSRILNHADAMNISYQIYDHAKMNDFLPLIDSSFLIGFSDKMIYRYYDISRISFVPFFLSDGSFPCIETHLITLKNTFIDKEMQQYIDWEKKKWGNIY